MNKTDPMESLCKQVEMLESKYAMQTSLLQQLTLEAGKMESALDFLGKHTCRIEDLYSGVGLYILEEEGLVRHYVAKTLLECVRLAKQSGNIEEEECTTNTRVGEMSTIRSKELWKTVASNLE